jgi:hypothetical protein
MPQVNGRFGRPGRTSFSELFILPSIPDLLAKRDSFLRLATNLKLRGAYDWERVTHPA